MKWGSIAPTVGNYDYVLDWVFDQKGSITYRAGATGIDSVKGVAAQKLADGRVLVFGRVDGLRATTVRLVLRPACSARCAA